MALAWDGVMRLPQELHPAKNLKLAWAMAVERYETKYRPIAKEETATSIRIVLANKLLNQDLNPREVVLFRYRGGHVLHRILQRKGNDLLIQGDGSKVAMEQCTVDDVVGKVTSVHRPSGKTVSVESWQWKLPSRLWRGLGCLRKWILRIAYRLVISVHPSDTLSYS